MSLLREKKTDMPASSYQPQHPLFALESSYQPQHPLFALDAPDNGAHSAHPFENSEGLLSWAQGKWSARKKKKLEALREKLRLLCQQSKQSGCKKRDVAQTTTGAQERSQTEKRKH